MFYKCNCIVKSSEIGQRAVFFSFDTEQLSNVYVIYQTYTKLMVLLHLLAWQQDKVGHEREKTQGGF